MKFSINNQVILEPYVDPGMRSEVVGGIARPVQRNRLVGLRVLADTRVSTPGNNYPLQVPEGSLAYISEERLASANTVWARAKMRSDLIEGEFIVADAAHIVAFDLNYPETENQEPADWVQDEQPIADIETDIEGVE